MGGRGFLTMKWSHRIAQGFYEAELVNSALQKKYFLSYWFLGSGSGQKGVCNRLIGVGRCGVGVRRRNEQTPEAVSAFEVRFCGYWVGLGRLPISGILSL